MSRPRLLLFPGLGGDGRVFGPQCGLPLDIELVEWIAPESPRESLGHYASRLVDRLGPRPGAFVGGISLGAMVALEAAAGLGARGVLVIGGCSSHKEISGPFQLLLALGAAMPVRALRPSLSVAPAAFRLIERLSPAHAALMARMLKEHPPEQLQWGCRAILDWQCCVTHPAVAVHRIHGAADEVIPPRRIAGQVLVAGGKHLINLSHAAEVNAFIMRVAQGTTITASCSAASRYS